MLPVESRFSSTFKQFHVLAIRSTNVMVAVVCDALRLVTVPIPMCVIINNERER
jgi:hypothetical protein